MKIKFLKILFTMFLLLGCSNQEDFSDIIIEPEIVPGLNLKSSYITGQNVEFYVFDQNQNILIDYQQRRLLMNCLQKNLFDL